MEQLHLRILINHVQGAEIAYFYNRESFNLLNIIKQEYDQSQFVEIGDIIKINGEDYIVKNLNFKMENQLFNLNPEYGVNMYSPTDPTQYNCQVGIFVDNI